MELVETMIKSASKKKKLLRQSRPIALKIINIVFNITCKSDIWYFKYDVLNMGIQ